MENFNKVLSFVLGLVVVVVFVIVLSGRLNIRSDIFTVKKISPTPTVKITVTPTPAPKEEKSFFSRLFSRKPKTTPSPTMGVTKPSPTPIFITEKGTQPRYDGGQTTQKGGASKVSEIPSTGPMSLLLPLFGSSALLGIYLRKRK